MSRSITKLAVVLLLGLAACAKDATSPTSQTDAALAVQTATSVLGAVPLTGAAPPAMVDAASGMMMLPPGGTQCTWDAAAGRWSCAPVTMRGGLTMTRSFAFYDANGVAQERPDRATTRSMNVQMAVAGTITLSDGALTVDRHNSTTVSGLGTASYTINGNETGTTKATRTTTLGTSTFDEAYTNATKDLVVPAPPSRGYPLSGTQSHTSTVTMTAAGLPPQTHTTAVVVTFNGTGTAAISITFDGTTRQCTIDLATGGRPFCP